MFFIRQNATHKIVVGPAVAVGDGFTPVTTVVLTGAGAADEAEVILHDNGTVVDISAYTWAAITTADGYYHLTLAAGITSTVGHMTVVIQDDSLILPLRADFQVVEEATYDLLFAAAATAKVTLADGAHGGAAATLTLLSAVVNNTGGSGVKIDGTTHGVEITASAGPGIEVDGTTFGLQVDASAGPGAHIGGTTIGLDVDASAGLGVDIDGTTFGIDVAASAGSGVSLVSGGGNGHGITIAGNGTGNGMSVVAGASGDGIVAQGGSTSGTGIVAQANQATSTSGNGISAYGFGTNSYGVRALGGVTSGPGMSVEARANNDAGLVCVKHGTGKDIDADQIDTIAVDVAGLDGAAMRGTDSAALATVCTEGRLAELDAANLPTDVANVKTDTAAILIDTAVIGAAGAGLTAVPWNAAWDAEVQSECADAITAASLSTLTAAQVNAEVVDALNVDTYAEPAQGAPAATTSLAAKIGYLFKAWRNKSTQTATELKIYNDAEAVVDHKSVVSDDGTTFSRGEVTTGP